MSTKIHSGSSESPHGAAGTQGCSNKGLAGLWPQVSSHPANWDRGSGSLPSPGQSALIYKTLSPNNRNFVDQVLKNLSICQNY